MQDPTYDHEKIRRNREWRVAFVLSEWFNEDAPLGWSRYIQTARAILKELEE